MLPTPTPEVVPVRVADHVFAFRRLTWRDEMRFFEQRKVNPALSVLAFALATVDGKAMDLQGADKLIMGLPRPVRERLIILYKGSLPSNRLLDADLPPAAPEPRAVQAIINEESEEAEQSAEDFLERKFGRDEVAAANAQAEAIARTSGLQGVTRPLPDGDVTEDAPSTTLPSNRYMAVM